MAGNLRREYNTRRERGPVTIHHAINQVSRGVRTKKRNDMLSVPRSYFKGQKVEDFPSMLHISAGVVHSTISKSYISGL
jgi:hypothetical protein